MTQLTSVDTNSIALLPSGFSGVLVRKTRS